MRSAANCIQDADGDRGLVPPFPRDGPWSSAFTGRPSALSAHDPIGWGKVQREGIVIRQFRTSWIFPASHCCAAPRTCDTARL
ncbi:hypothetical protein HMPREF9946_01741 [Acetobacteraceae bacterium AT-5844]|nr:hypothetical protein HMPREF9946_01741 [Acetobacteraceae bacterium AT-5844]